MPEVAPRLKASSAECDAVGILFERLGAIYGASVIASKFAGDPDMLLAEWVRGLRGMTASEIERGLESCVTRTEANGFPPSLPEFRALCRPYRELYGYAVDQMIRQLYGSRAAPRWPGRALYWAMHRIWPEASIAANYNMIARRWRVEYDRAALQELAGQLPDIPAPALMLEHRETPEERETRIKHNRANAAKHLGAIRALL